MHIPSLQKIREELEKKQNGDQQNYDQIYPFWNLKDNDYCIIRFLPDKDETNTFFWRERQIIKLPFRGTEEEPNKSVVVQVPCVEMYDKWRKCPITSYITPWFRDPSKESLAKTYWKKRSYIFQGFVIRDPLGSNSENPIRRFIINPSIFKIIKASLMDPEIEDSPVDFVNGRDFKLQKTKKGEYSDYSTSKWSMKTRELTDEELENIEKYGLYNLMDFLPKYPSSEELDVIFDMFKASLAGELYSYKKWGNYYKPNDFDNGRKEDSSKIDLMDDLSAFDLKQQKVTNETNKNVDDENKDDSEMNHEEEKSDKVKKTPLEILEALRRNKKI